MENKELIKEYNTQFFRFVNTVDEAVQMVLSGKQMVIAQDKVKADKEYTIVTTIDFIDGEFVVKVSSEYPYADELQELFQCYVDYRYTINEEYTPNVINNNKESFFNELVRQSDESGEKCFAIGCPDEQMFFLREVAEYINKQDGWNARIEDDIMLVERE